MRYWLVTLLLLASCSPKPISVPQAVDIPVPVACTFDKPAMPVWKVPGARRKSYADKIKAMSVDLNNAHAYINVLNAMIDAK